MNAHPRVPSNIVLNAYKALTPFPSSPLPCPQWKSRRRASTAQIMMRERHIERGGAKDRACRTGHDERDRI